MSLRFLLRPNALLYVRLLPALAAGLLLAITVATTQLPPLARGASIAFIVASVLAAFLPKRDDVKTHGSATLAVFAVASSGQTRGGIEYAASCVLFALFVVACLRAPLVASRIRGAASPSAGLPGAAVPLTGRRARAFAVLGVVTTAFAAFLIVSLPRLSAYVERQVQRLAGDIARDDDQVGFNTRIRIGSLRHMLHSDRVVMRVSGQPTTYLRGIVLDRYDSRLWLSSLAELPVAPSTADAPLERTTTHIELSRAALAAHVTDPRWFLPEDACDVHTQSGRMAVDAHRAAHPDPPNDTREISFAHEGAGTCSQHLPPETPPSSTDLRMAEVVRRRLAPIADGWTRGSATERETVEAIIHELSRFAYSLDDRREGSLDPVVEFLTKTQAGHCELFASALALLARTRGIPTRLVVGYRVDELNPFTGRSVVRDRNAHTWVEAWIDGRWQSFDPTPLAEMHASTRPSGWENLTEAISYGWDVTVRFIVDLGLLGVGTIFAVAAVVLLVIRRIQRRRVKAAPEMTATSRPLPAFETLTTALAHVGWERPASEPLERFARRVDRSGEPWSSDVADALTRYAELRYGGLGEARSVARRLDEVARKVATTS